MHLKIKLEAVRRLKHIAMILHPALPMKCAVTRSFCAKTIGTNNLDILRTTFSDIDVNLLTSEEKCKNFTEYYSNLPQEQRNHFLCEMAKDFGINKDSTLSVANSIMAAREKGEANLLSASDRLRSALRPKYKTLFAHIGRIQGGVKFLVDLRADILMMRQNITGELEAALYQELNSALRELLMLWFTVGFLNLERITWQSPCDLVQKVSNYEAVHKIKTWADIKRRVGPYRRCYIFTHNSMPREPVVVLHTALTSEISSSIHSIIKNTRSRPSQSSSNAGEDISDFYMQDAASSTISSPSPSTSESPSYLSSTTSSELHDEEKEDSAQICSAVFYSITSTQKDEDWGPVLDERSGDWRIRPNKEIHNLYKSSPITSVLKTDRLRWLGQVERMEKDSEKLNMSFHRKWRGKDQQKMNTKKLAVQHRKRFAGNKDQGLEEKDQGQR